MTKRRDESRREKGPGGESTSEKEVVIVTREKTAGNDSSLGEARTGLLSGPEPKKA